MSFSNAIEHFETVLRMTADKDDPISTHLAQGLIELTKQLRRELKDVDSKLDDIKRQVR